MSAVAPATSSPVTASCVHRIGPFPTDPDIRSLPCLGCGKPIRLYGDPLTCSVCGRLAPYGERCVTHDPRSSST